LKFKTSEIASASLSGTTEQILVRWSQGLLDLFRRPCTMLLAHSGCIFHSDCIPPYEIYTVLFIAAGWASWD